MSEPEPLPRNEYVLDLTHRLQQALKHDLYFAHALFEQSTEAETDILESLIGLTNGRRSEEMDDDARKNFQHLKTTDRKRGETKPITRARRLFRTESA